MQSGVLAVGAVLAVVSHVPFGATAMRYRHRDNGLAFLLLVLGAGLWNGMFAAQTLSPDPTVKVFFLSLTVVGSLLAGLGWFLFATTASRTTDVLSTPAVYATIGVVAGLDVIFAITAPAHSLYWSIPETMPASLGFAVVVPHVGYWLHVGVLVGLFAAGAVLFAGAWEAELDVTYTRNYALLGTATVVAVVAGAIFAPGGLSVASLLAATLPAVGWLQARRGQVLRTLRPGAAGR